MLINKMCMDVEELTSSKMCYLIRKHGHQIFVVYATLQIILHEQDGKELIFDSVDRICFFSGLDIEQVDRALQILADNAYISKSKTGYYSDAVREDILKVQKKREVYSQNRKKGYEKKSNEINQKPTIVEPLINQSTEDLNTEDLNKEPEDLKTELVDRGGGNTPPQSNAEVKNQKAPPPSSASSQTFEVEVLGNKIKISRLECEQIGIAMRSAGLVPKEDFQRVVQIAAGEYSLQQIEAGAYRHLTKPWIFQQITKEKVERAKLDNVKTGYQKVTQAQPARPNFQSRPEPEELPDDRTPEQKAKDEAEARKKLAELTRGKGLGGLVKSMEVRV